MASYPWVVPHERQQQDMADFPALAKWYARIQARPATVKAYELADRVNQNKTVDEESKKILFGQDASSVN
jgi:GST-like protein